MQQEVIEESRRVGIDQGVLGECKFVLYLAALEALMGTSIIANKPSSNLPMQTGTANCSVDRQT